MPDSRLRAINMSVFGSFHAEPGHRNVGGGRAFWMSPYTEEWSWGRLELPDPLQTARGGIANYRLRVYAPGTSELERRDLVLAKRWWLGTGIILSAGEIVAASASLGATAAAVLALSGLGIAWYWLARTSKIRRRTRSLRVAVVTVGGPREVLGDAALFRDCRHQLAILDDPETPANPLARQAIWAAVYDKLDPVRPDHPRGRARTFD